MNEHWKKIRNTVTVVAILLCGLIPLSCDIFETDGASSNTVITNGYFYIMDRTDTSIVMLNDQLAELKRWNVMNVTHDASMQGITFDGSYLWISTAGSADKLIQLDATEDTLIAVKSFDAPPQRKGTVRDIAWDGTALWALNSGSEASSIPPKLYKIDPSNGTILNEYQLPTHDPRGLTYVKAYTDVYGHTASAGLVYTDITTNKAYKLLPEISSFDTVFTSPTPPRGTSYAYPAGITYDGTYFWVINSSNTADHLYKISYLGKEESRYDLQISQPGPIVYSHVDVRIPPAPVVFSINPESGALGEAMNIDISGSGFKSSGGLTVNMGSGITVDSIRFIATTEIIASVRIDSFASVGKRNVTITNPGGRFVTIDSSFEVTLTPIIPHLWLVEQDLDSLYQIRLRDTMVVKKWDTRVIAGGGSPQGLAYDGTNIWLCASGTDRKIYKVNTSGAALTTIGFIAGPTASGTLRGITWEAGSLWVTVSAIGTAGRIYRVDPVSGAVQDSISTPGVEPRGVVFAGGSLYCNDTSLDSVYVYNTGTSLWRAVFSTPIPTGGTTGNRFATGMTWDGHNFWIANSTGNFDHVYKVTPTGVILQYFQSPRIGAAQITGITYTPN